MDTTLSSRVPGTVVPYVIYLASKHFIKLQAGLSILKIRWYKFSTFLFTIFWALSMLKCYYRPTASLQLNNKRNTKYNITVT